MAAAVTAVPVAIGIAGAGSKPESAGTELAVHSNTTRTRRELAKEVANPRARLRLRLRATRALLAPPAGPALDG